MQSVSIAEAKERLPELLAGLSSAPVLVLDEGKVVGMLSSPEAAETERQAAWRRLCITSERLSAQLEANLAKDGLTVEGFLEDVLRDDA